MASPYGPLVSVRNPQTQIFPGLSLMQVDQCLSSKNIFIRTTSQGKSKALKYRRPFAVQASGERSTGAFFFLGGFVLGGLVVGALGCIYAPQLSEALVGENRKVLMRKLPKFIYDEERALEKTRKILTEKIAQLNSAIDDISAQLHSRDAPNGAAGKSDELEASV
ncbi:uncharacterized protein LOC130784581 isoform X1 [Actinidia eriantha]|uniref:uncharacterized protein LOC130784581 isoform X1 n=2 Tax=Actinidia eriantha TaxID=165200 RepID=UPI002585AB31|nr:uncharacterized protein LOC130784581 isoform X1 [Actinidia eriantha]